MTNKPQRKPTRVEIDESGPVSSARANRLGWPALDLWPNAKWALSLYYWPPNQLAFALRNREVYPFESQASANGLGEVEK